MFDRYFVLRAVDPAAQQPGVASSLFSHELMYFNDEQWLGKQPKGTIAVGGSGDTIIGEAFAKGHGKCITMDTQGQNRQYRWVPDRGNDPWIQLLRNIGRAEEERQGQT